MRDSGAERPRHWTWAALMRRAIDLDVLRCPRCAGRMQLIATIDDPAVIQRILAHLGLPGARDGPPLQSSVPTAPAKQPGLPSGSLYPSSGWTHAGVEVCPHIGLAARG